MGTKRVRDDQTPDDPCLVRWRTLGIGIKILLGRLRRVYTGVILHRLHDAQARGLLPGIVADLDTTTRPFPPTI